MGRSLTRRGTGMPRLSLYSELVRSLAGGKKESDRWQEDSWWSWRAPPTMLTDPKASRLSFPEMRHWFSKWNFLTSSDSDITQLNTLKRLILYYLQLFAMFWYTSFELKVFAPNSCCYFLRYSICAVKNSASALKFESIKMSRADLYATLFYSRSTFNSFWQRKVIISWFPTWQAIINGEYPVIESTALMSTVWLNIMSCTISILPNSTAMWMG